MNILFIGVEIAATLIESFLCFYFLGPLVHKTTRRDANLYYFLAICLTVLVLLINSFVLFSLFTVLFAIVFVSLSLKYFYHADIGELLSLSSFYYLYLGIIDFLCISLLGILVSDPQIARDILQTFSIQRCIFIIFSKFILILGTVLMHKFLIVRTVNTKQIIPLTILSYIGITFLIDLTISSIDLPITLNWFLVLNITILIVFAFSWYSKYKQEQHGKKIAELKNASIQEKYLHFKENSEQTRKLLHDFSNHMLVLSNLIEEKQNEQALHYINSIGIEKEKQNIIPWTGNPIVDFLINYKQTEATKQNITFNINTDRISFHTIADEDLCIILANLLDNSIEACCKVEDSSRWINITLRQIEGIIVMKIENSIKKPLIIKGQFPMTSKEERWAHGIGLKSVQTAVDKYNGQFHYSCNEESFIACVTFFNG